MSVKKIVFREGDKITVISMKHDIASESFSSSVHRVAYHGHINLDEIQQFIESKEVLPKRKVKRRFYYPVLNYSGVLWADIHGMIGKNMDEAQSNADKYMKNHAGYKLETIQSIDLEVEE